MALHLSDHLPRAAGALRLPRRVDRAHRAGEWRDHPPAASDGPRCETGGGGGRPQRRAADPRRRQRLELRRVRVAGRGLPHARAAPRGAGGPAAAPLVGAARGVRGRVRPHPGRGHQPVAGPPDPDLDGRHRAGRARSHRPHRRRLAGGPRRPGLLRAQRRGDPRGGGARRPRPLGDRDRRLCRGPRRARGAGRLRRAAAGGGRGPNPRAHDGRRAGHARRSHRCAARLHGGCVRPDGG